MTTTNEGVAAVVASVAQEIRITEVEPFLLHVPVTGAHIADSMHRVTHWGVCGVVLHTDAGLRGYGYTGTHAHRECDQLITDCIARVYSPLLRGESIHDVQRLWQKLYRFPAKWVGRAGITQLALAAVDIAIWDLKAKACGLPLWRLLGGAKPDGIQAYNTDGGWLSLTKQQLVDNCRRNVEEEGFRGFKMKVGSPNTRHDVERVEAVRRAIGQDIRLMVDANGCYDLPTAIALGSHLEDLKSRGSRNRCGMTILAAMVAMVLTAISYGRMAALYPSAGSAYTYVGRGLHPYLGFVSGWAMLLDYIVCPLFCVIYGTLAITRALPMLPFPVGAALFAGGITYLNLRGIRSTARANQLVLGFMFAVLFVYIGLAIRFLLIHQGIAGLFSIKPFYNAATFKVHDIAGATSFAALTYLGFDSVTTLAEDVKNPRRSVMLATVSVCLFTGLFGGLLVYLGQLVWPNYSTYSNIETAFIEVSGRVGGIALFRAMALLIVVASAGAGMTTQVGASRLLYGMGRDNVIPGRFFAYLDPIRNSPSRNILLIGLLAYAGSLVMSYEVTAEILNFGAFLGFMGVNFAVIWEFWVRRSGTEHRAFATDVVVPGLGFVFCTIIWLGLGTPAKIAGGIWFVLGVFVLAWHTQGFREQLALPDPASYE